MRICFSIQCSMYLYRRVGGRRHKSQCSGDWYLHKLSLFWCVHSPSVLSHTAITALQLNCQLWLNQIFGQIIQTNHGQSLARQQPGSDRGLHWAGPHLTAAACLLSIIISWHRLYLLYLVSSIYPVSRPTLYLYNQIVRHQHLQERYGRSTALAWLLGRKVCRKNIWCKSTWFCLWLLADRSE